MNKDKQVRLNIASSRLIILFPFANQTDIDYVVLNATGEEIDDMCEWYKNINTQELNIVDSFKYVQEYNNKKKIMKDSVANNKGMKLDNDKPNYFLLMAGAPRALEAVVNVMDYGAKKYAAFNWLKVENPKQRYMAAMYRHLGEYLKGNYTDRESGLPHLDHALCSLLFVVELDKQSRLEDAEK